MTSDPKHEPVPPPFAGQNACRERTAGGWRRGWLRTLLLGGATGILLLMPFVLAAYPLVILCHMLVFSIACLALNLVFGTAGMLSLGHATYFGVAAYTGAFLYRFFDIDSLELFLLSGILSSGIFAAVIGFFCVRTTRIFFAVLTLAFSMVVYSLVIDGAVFQMFGGVGRALYYLGEGSMYVPRLTMLGKEISAGEFISVFYNVIVAGFIASVLLLWRITSSPFGQALKAIRDNEARAAFIGIPVRQYRWYAFILSGFFMGLAGGLYGQLARQITPDQLHWLFSAQFVLANVLGGTRHFLGPVIGAFAFVGLDEVASRWTVGRSALFGVLLIFVVFAFPRGILGGLLAVMDAVKKYRSHRR